VKRLAVAAIGQDMGMDYYIAKTQEVLEKL
jgi:hypothetical protein